ncbi:6-bladed beta-propeller [Alkaliflexus imshenetskii]|uniref:6-bladed beta-propeller n=1 Tax=Alkaliflexus imshenetskii TaxID=286730 RepID=UPI00047AD8D3|nr:6-bladed beta-propeller [Alkaliflexus imshenetskii]
MKALCLSLVLSFVLIKAFGQKQYYFDISEIEDAYYKINLYDTKVIHDADLTFEIQSFTLSQSKRGYRINKIRKVRLSDALIYVTDISNTNLFIYDLLGKAQNKIDITRYDERAWITDFTVYKDTIYIVDNRSLFLFKFSAQGDFLAKEILTFNFEDFMVNTAGLHFISKHETGSRNNTLRINVFDHSLNLLKQYFLTSRTNDSLFMPRFFQGMDEEVLFSVYQNNEIFNVRNNVVSKFMRIENAKMIYNYAHVNGFHSFRVSSGNKILGVPLWTCYVKNGTAENVRFENFRSDDLSLFLFNGFDCGIHQDKFVSYLDFNSFDLLRSIPDMTWSPEHESIKKDFFKIVNQIKNHPHHVIVLFKIVKAHSIL